MKIRVCWTIRYVPAERFGTGPTYLPSGLAVTSIGSGLAWKELPIVPSAIVAMTVRFITSEPQRSFLTYQMNSPSSLAAVSI